MRNWQQLWLVTQWEFMHFFKLKQEVIGKLIMLGIGVFIYLWQNSVLSNADVYRVGVDAQLPNLSLGVEFEQQRGSTEALLQQLRQEEVDAVLLKSAPVDSNQLSLALHTLGKNAWQRDLVEAVNRSLSAQKADELGITDSTLALLQQPGLFEFHYLDDDIKTGDEASTMTATGVLILMAIGVFMSFAQIFVSITGEKQQRVTEQLYACMDAQTWIDGKILGQMLHALKAMVSTTLSILLGMAFVQLVLRNQAINFSMIDFSLLPVFLLFAILGLYMVTAFMAAIAAAIDDPNHSGKSSFMMIPLLPILLCFFFTDSPSSVLLSFLSYFPLTAFAAMPMKMALVTVPFWQVLLAIISTLIGCYVLRVAAGRMFKMGMVMYGKEPTFRQMLAWAVTKKT